MSKNTNKNCKIPSRISVCFDRKTDKFIITKNENGTYHLEKNRLVVKGKHTEKDIINIIQESFGYTPPPKPDLQEKDCVSVFYDTGENDLYNQHRCFLAADPILNYAGEWVVPVFIPLVGMRYINCENIKLLRRMK